MDFDVVHSCAWWLPLGGSDVRSVASDGGVVCGILGSKSVQASPAEHLFVLTENIVRPEPIHAVSRLGTVSLEALLEHRISKHTYCSDDE